MSPLLEAALRHARAGRPVFPCGPDKAPKTAHGFKDASVDPATIRRWFAGDALLAIPTGKVSGLVVLDVDEDKGGYESLREPSFATNRSLEPRPSRRLAAALTATSGGLG